MKKLLIASICSIVLMWSSSLQAQESKSEGYVFTPVKDIKHTPVKNQSSTSTCWIFSGLGFLEAELVRIGKPEMDLSEMYISKNAYMDKADKYVRMQKTINYGPGGSFWDVIDAIKKYGITTEEAYKGMNYGEERHV